MTGCGKMEDGRYEVVLDSTPFFPGGGGQPPDRGWIGAGEVLDVHPGPSGEIVHVLGAPVSGEVEARIDWEIRYHFMQHHSAQHIVTATASGSHGWETSAMHLGLDGCDVELAVPGLSLRDLRPLQSEVNALVRSNRSIRTLIAARPQLERLGVRSRRLPEGLEEGIRLVDIEGVDLNTCGGTHVASTAEIQLCVFTGTEQLRGGTRVHFAAGNLALGLFDEMLDRQRLLCQALSCGPGEHPAAVEKLRESARESRRRAEELLAELSRLVAAVLAGQDSPAHAHRREATPSLLRAIASEYRRLRPGGVVLLTAGEGGRGHFMLAGPPDIVSKAGPAVAASLSGRGGGGEGFFQGGARRVDASVEALAAIREAMDRRAGS